ncbi:MAG: hypothetical protein MRY79_03910 [Alphaproteobacteria bacterium]|nr:hypothetical protein [Alphaproteobacteria bacterium]
MSELKNLSPQEIDELVFFSAQSPKPDYNYWSKMAYWEINEAIFLTYGVCPKSDYNPPKEYDKNASPLAKEIRSLGDIARRAKRAKELTYPVKPTKYIEWLNKININIPEQLEGLIQEKRTQPAQNPDIPKPLHTKERESLLKLVICLAIEGYRYDPKAMRNDAVQEIARDLEKYEIPLNPDTIRKYLKDGAEILPVWPENR